MSDITRLEIIDWTEDLKANNDISSVRRMVIWDDSVEITTELQDDGKTLKVFVTDRKQDE